MNDRQNKLVNYLVDTQGMDVIEQFEHLPTEYQEIIANLYNCNHKEMVEVVDLAKGRLCWRAQLEGRR